MIVYREFMDLTEEEIRQVLTDLFHPISIEDIRKDEKWNSWSAHIVTGGWETAPGEEPFEVEDDVTLRMPGCGYPMIDVDFSLTFDDRLLYEKFLLAKGCDRRLKDNPYYNTERITE